MEQMLNQQREDNMKRYYILFIITFLLGCTPKIPTSPVSEDNMVYGRMEEVILKDGTRCITWKDGYAGGLSCDWDGK